MNALTFDTLSIAKRLKANGLNDQQAEAIAFELKEARNYDTNHLATKGDIEHLAEKMDTRMNVLEYRLTLKLGLIVGSILGFFRLMERFF